MSRLSIRLALVATLLFGFAGCRTGLPDVGAGPPLGQVTEDGLVLVRATDAGSLYLREDHGIGGYDAVVIVPSFVNYQRSSSRLEDEQEYVYLASLEQTLFDATREAQVEVVKNAAPCVIKIGVGFINLKLARAGSRNPVLGEMTTVMEFRDSTSNESLMRFVAPKRIEREPEGADRVEHVRRSFDRIIAELDIVRVLQSARIAPSPPRPGCKGELLKARPRNPV
jgi:hypothetical protein